MVARFLLPFLMLTAAATASAQALEVIAVRHWTFAGVTRVAIETNGDFRFRSNHLDNPERLVFDLLGATPHVDGHRFVKREVNDTFLKRVRLAETKPGVTRVVLDLERPVEYTASQLSNPDRLMIELHAPSDKPPAAPPVLLAKTLVTTPHPVIREPDTTPAPITSFAPDLPATLREDHTAAVFAKAEVKTPATLPSPPVLTPKVSEPERPSERASFNASARAARLAATQSMTRALGLKINRVVIDAGHGGHDQGTSGPHGLLEKDLTLDVAQRLGKLIEQRLGSEVIYTRSDDTYIGLHERTAIANRSKADLFLSIHANSSKATGVTGVETYYLNFTSSAESMNVAARENATAENSVFELKDLVQTITLHDKIEESKEFATCVQGALQSFESRNFASSKNRGIRKAPFVVLIGASMPSILAEVGFVSNPREETQLSRAAYRQRLAEALYQGVARYANSLSHFTLAEGGSPKSRGMGRGEDTDSK